MAKGKKPNPFAKGGKPGKDEEEKDAKGKKKGKFPFPPKKK